MRWDGLWRIGAGTHDDPNNGRLWQHILGVHPGRWRQYRDHYPDDLLRTRLGYVRLLWQELRRYPTEVCHRCGRAVKGMSDTWWSAPHELWLEVMGGHGGILCPLCFTGACERRGIRVYWEPVVWKRDGELTGART